ncbi:MAG: hypothetical protein KC516_02305 [Nanoarchaeota archaeon]|nr:hypothetical protein [Nanoarchaeota archaeon]
MKKEVFVFTLLLTLMIVLSSIVSAASCDLEVSMINQDPYPAIPGDYVKVVFQVDGVSNPECGQINFELLEQYPLIFDPGQTTKKTIDSGVYHKDFSSFLIAPYKVRIDQNALNGDTPIEVRYGYGTGSGTQFTEQFDLNIEDTRADFEIYVKNYDPISKEITFEILNTAESDIQALTIEIPQQGNINVKGSKTNIVGDLDSNDYTTATFEATPLGGEIMLKISYTDSINERRTLEKTVLFEPEYFEGRSNGSQKVSIWLYLFIILLIVAVVRHFLRKRKAKKKLQRERKK